MHLTECFDTPARAQAVHSSLSAQRLVARSSHLATGLAHQAQLSTSNTFSCTDWFVPPLSHWTRASRLRLSGEGNLELEQ